MNKTQGTIWHDPAQFTLPDSDYAQPSVHFSFAGRFKASSKEPNHARPIDPSLRAEAVGTDWPRPRELIREGVIWTYGSFHMVMSL